MRHLLPGVLALLLCAGCAAASPARSHLYWAPRDPLVSYAVAMLRDAERSIDLAMRDLSSPAIADALEAAARRGVTIRLITDRFAVEGSRPERLVPSQAPRLQRAGIAVTILGTPGERTMHHKFAIVDGRLLWLGSWNWREEDALANWEDVLVLEDARLIRQFQARFNALWQRAQ